ncbi:hypothetical protein GCM10017668_05530 [Streptomyces tuirus]|uniref:Uncharacterized protein n=1 Tax=Streptomyces tuirus TaxID=68278 RepID=A0A7G1NAI1_9ACTN|nr:hypothetical protein GCM10017668_05530 [Streptomyces tuirus]
MAPANNRTPVLLPSTLASSRWTHVAPGASMNEIMGRGRRRHTPGAIPVEARATLPGPGAFDREGPGCA